MLESFQRQNYQSEDRNHQAYSETSKSDRDPDSCGHQVSCPHLIRRYCRIDAESETMLVSAVQSIVK